MFTEYATEPHIPYPNNYISKIRVLKKKIHFILINIAKIKIVNVTKPKAGEDVEECPLVVGTYITSL